LEKALTIIVPAPIEANRAISILSYFANTLRCSIKGL